MCYEAEVMAFLHEAASDGMAVTVLGPVKHLKKRIASRIPISVLGSHERERDRDSHTDRFMQRNKDSERSAYPRSDREWSYRQVDVRYLTKLKDRFMSSYSCNQQECPMIKGRLEHHHMQKHRGQGSNHQDEAVASSVNIMKQLISTKSGPDIEDAQSFQKSIQNVDKIGSKDINPHNNSNRTYKFNNYYNDIDDSKQNHFDDDNLRYNVQSKRKENRRFNNGRISLNSKDIRNSSQCARQYEQKESNDNIPLKRTKTRELLAPKRNIYKDYVQRDVKDWFQEVPVYPNIGERSDNNKDGILNYLSDEITNLSNEYNKESYEGKVKCVIEKFLDKTPMWFPGAKRDQQKFKNKLIANLLKKIRYLNQRFLDSNVQNTNKRSSASEKPISLHNNEIKVEIDNWLDYIKLRRNSRSQMEFDKRKLSQALVNRLVPMLDKPTNTCHFRLNLKSVILEILNCFPIENKNIQLHKLIHELANKIIMISQTQHENHSNGSYRQQAMCYNNYSSDVGIDNTKNNLIKNVIKNEINECFGDTVFAHHNIVKSEITDIIKECVQTPYATKDFDVEKEIFNLLKRSLNISQSSALHVANTIVRCVNNALNKNDQVSYIKPLLNRNISVYSSQEICCPTYPATSTPKKIKSIPRLNNEEIKYSGEVANLIRTWMETLPVQLNAPDELEYKETMIDDLAGNLTDVVKLQQLASVGDTENWLTYTVYKWINKLNLFDLEEVTPQIKEFIRKLGNIPVPLLTRPQHGNRQVLANIQHIEGELGIVNEFIPKAEDILEDEISIWMNQQSSDIFDINNKSARGYKIHELAEGLKDKLNDKRPEHEILSDLATWLTNIVKPEQRNHVNLLAENLKSRVILLPHDATLTANVEKKKLEKAERIEEKKKPQVPLTFTTTNSETVERDNTMQQYIAKFIEHNYDTDDLLARGALNKLLKSKLQLLNPPTRKEIYDNFGKCEPNHDMLFKELEYIKLVSDWLKNMPVENGYNTVGNRQRVDFVNDMARNILEVEEEREANPEAMDFNLYLASVICQCLINLPIIEEYKNDDYITYMIEVLLGKVIIQRRPNLNNTSGIYNDNIGDFVEEFIRINGSEIANDEVKLEAWSVRLLKEIKKMAYENEDPETLSKAKVYKRLANIPLPGDESIKQFENEFEYIKEISQWIKNLPLLPSDQSLEKARINLIYELSEKLTERDNQKSTNPDNKADAEFNEYVSKWITDLSLDESHEVIATVVIQQLLNRIERVKAKQKNNIQDLTHTNEPFTTNDSTEGVSRKAKNSKQINNPTNTIVESIEMWSESLPINIDDEKASNFIRNDVSKKLFQKVGELCLNPRTNNDDLLYHNLLIDEVDAIVELLPQTPELQENKEQLMTKLVDSIVEAQKAMKENNAGEYYKQKLVHSIEASIPHPISPRKAYNPGFEIYKTRLADMFILENFDYGCDDVKIKYERRIKDEIDKYYDDVKNKCAIPLTNDEIYNELYSALFKVPIPSESSVIGEVKVIKTRCVIDDWFDLLPLSEASGLNELLERDLILATLAKKIHEIEKSEKKPADKIHKEIMKWLVKLPLLPEHKHNTEEYAKKLEDKLKSSMDTRTCIVTNQTSKRIKSKSKLKSQDHECCATVNMLENQQISLVPKKKAAEVMIEIIEDWCSHIPMNVSEECTLKNIKDTLATKIIIKISELNMNPITFNDDYQYGLLLDEELERLLSTVPACCNFEESKEAKKMQLKDAIKSIKHLFKEERARHQYKVELDKTVAKILGEPENKSEDKETLFQNLKEEIMDNFVLYNYEKDDDEGRQAYKIKVHEAVVKFLNATEKKDSMNPLIKRNQILCELAKIRIPSEDGLKEYVEEVRMKNEISELFDDLSIPKGKNKQLNQVKSCLAKKLNEIEINGHGPDMYEKMKLDIINSLKKLNKQVKPEIIEKFIQKLRNNETVRRAPRNKKNKTCAVQKYNLNTKPLDKNSRKRSNDVSQRLEIHKKTKFECECAKTEQKQLAVKYSNEPDDLRSKTIAESEFPKTNIALSEKSPAAEYYDNRSRKDNDRQESPTKEEFGNPRTEFAQNERPLSPDTETDDRDSLSDMDTCRECGRRRIRTCFMRRRWCGPEEVPICRMPAYFYY